MTIFSSNKFGLPQYDIGLFQACNYSMKVLKIIDSVTPRGVLEAVLSGRMGDK